MGLSSHGSQAEKPREEINDVWKTFEQLMEKSQRCFNRLREIPPYVKHHWESYFHKAFHVYAKLWKFQQDNRVTLTQKGLKRWEIGDMASKIGQLYYNYYLRTSETRFLQEAYTFYEAIRSRQYFAQATNDQSLAIKQLRYFARFIIICLLMNRREEVWQLLQEFQALISSYIAKFQASDAQEWRVVINEITIFLNADRPLPQPLTPAHPNQFPLAIRCTPTAPEASVAPHKARLREAILISYYHKQVKIAELPLDTYRMLQTLEWLEPPSSNPSTPVQPMASLALDSLASPKDSSASDNPTKHLMFRPTAPQVLAMASTICDALPRDSILLIYICANAQRLPHSAPAADGVVQPSTPPTSSTEDGHSSSVSGNMSDGLFLGPTRSQEPADCFLLPEDLIPFTRQQLFLIVDSDISLSFCRIQGSERSRPCMCLMSPLERPPELQASGLSAHSTGNLFTQFLSTPPLAFCLLCNVLSPTAETLVKLQDVMDGVLRKWGLALGAVLGNTRSVWASAYQDALLRRHVLRFMLCRAALALHKTYGDNMSYIPSCFPDLPPCANHTAKEVLAGVGEIAGVLGCRELFNVDSEQAGKGGEDGTRG